jgi:hypothetical protein
MKKIALLVGIGIGFVLGSKAGDAPYKQLEAKVHDLMGRPEVKDAVEQVKSTTKEQAGTIIDKLPTADSSQGSNEIDIATTTLPHATGVDREVIVHGEVIAPRRADI